MPPGGLSKLRPLDSRHQMPLPVLVPMKTSFPSAKALKLFTWLTVSASKLNLSPISFSSLGADICTFNLTRSQTLVAWNIALPLFLD
jgi:hypothetical protein